MSLRASSRMRKRSAGTAREECTSHPARTISAQWSGPAMLCVVVVMAMLCGLSTVCGSEIKGLGFYPPFKTFNARGDRTVPSWSFGGASTAKQSFARIVPDFKNNFGTIFSRLTGRFNTGPPGGQFSLATTFRISGASDKDHGKYLAFVVGNPEMIRRRGDTYGFPENFVGVGIVISPRAPADMAELTPAGARPAGPRQFISFFANNGTRSTAEVRTLANSCASTLRYHEGRDDFSFLKSSRVRLGYYDGEVILEVDARNIGVWRKCIKTTVPDMPPGWLDRAAVAITAETGEATNNHDVMNLEVFSEKEEAFNERIIDGAAEDEGNGDEAAEALARTKRLYAIRAHLEHEFDAVERILKDSVAKLASVNDNIKRRLTSVEKTVSTEAFSFLNSRVKGIEERVKANAAPALETRLRDAQSDFHNEMGQSMEKLLDKGTGWRLPFIFILGVVGAVFAVSVKQYRRLMRSNFMGSMR